MSASGKTDILFGFRRVLVGGLGSLSTFKGSLIKLVLAPTCGPLINVHASLLNYVPTDNINYYFTIKLSIPLLLLL